MQKISDLSETMIKNIESKRKWVRDHFTPETINQYNTISGKLNLLDVILKSNWIDKNEILKFQYLGITLGDVFVQDMNFIWIQIEDEFGIDPAILLPDTTIRLFPMTMISKRIENGESIDIYEFYKGLKEKIKGIIPQA